MMSLFTVEQIELVRRLRVSGVTPEQVIEAFRILDRLDTELGRLGSGGGNGRTNALMGNGRLYQHGSVASIGQSNGHCKVKMSVSTSSAVSHFSLASAIAVNSQQRHYSPSSASVPQHQSVAENRPPPTVTQSPHSSAANTAAGLKPSPLLLQQLNSQLQNNVRQGSATTAPPTTAGPGTSLTPSATAMSALESALNGAATSAPPPSTHVRNQTHSDANGAILALPKTSSAPIATSTTAMPSLLPFLSLGHTHSDVREGSMIVRRGGGAADTAATSAAMSAALELALNSASTTTNSSSSVTPMRRPSIDGGLPLPAAKFSASTTTTTAMPSLLPFLPLPNHLVDMTSHGATVPNIPGGSPLADFRWGNASVDYLFGGGGGGCPDGGGDVPPARTLRTAIKPEVLEYCTLDDPDELDIFLAVGEEPCIAEMRDFVTQSSLRQTTVAHMTGVSQPYISKFLNGNFRELSQRVRRNIFSWYLNCRRHPHKINKFFAEAARYQLLDAAGSTGGGQPSTTTSPSLSSTGAADHSATTDRNQLAKPELTDILEVNYGTQPYPDFEQRLCIAAQCNKALQVEKGSGLSPRDVVSPQLIANWFANRRKNLKRKLDDDADRMTSAGGGRNSDTPISSTEHYSVGGGGSEQRYRHSASPYDVDGGVAGNTDSHRRIKTPPSRPTSFDGDDEHQRKTPASEQFSNMLQSELAAVNSSVLALVDPYGEHLQSSIVVKTENTT